MAHLFVIAGHGAGDPGATANGFAEAERVRALAAKIKERGGNGVTLADTSRNWYADGGLNALDLPDGWQVVELHMDAAPGARGGHVIYKAGMQPDAYDRALAERIAAMFPGRANRLVGRSDLANVNRAAARGIPYRLVENGFITSEADLGTFNARLDELAQLYVDVFGAHGEPEPAQPGALEVDGFWGGATTAALERAFGMEATGTVPGQYAAWRASNPGLTGGWQWGWSGEGSELVRRMQAWLGVEADGVWGPDTSAALQRRMGTPEDGQLWQASPAIAEMQRRINAGKLKEA